jgi:Ca2+-transporting ATPase
MVQTINTAVSGRARYKIKGLYRSEPLREYIEARFSHRQGISYVAVNTLTGNVLVLFNSGNSSNDIASHLEEIVLDYLKNLHTETPNPPSPPFAKGGEIKAGSSLKTGMAALRNQFNRAEDQPIEPWHLMSTAKVTDLMGTGRKNGLTVESVSEKTKRYGPNLLPESVPRSGLSVLLEQFKSLPVALLGVAAGISVFTGGIADAIVIMGVVGINAAIGYFTEMQTERTIHSLKSLVRPSAIAIRDGLYTNINAWELVPGDIIVLRPGSYVAADARLIEATHLSVDESALTGESMPASKMAEVIVSDDNIPLADRTNMVYMGTLVTGGQGLAVVVATGRYTEIGMIQILVGETRPPQTPMEKQLDTIGTQIVLICGGVCGIVFIAGILRGYGFLHMFKSAISLAVAAVPEGLPTVATTTLALGIRKMRRHNVLIRHLDAVEALGSVQTICLDKTGTLTMNRMSVVAIHTGMKHIRLSESNFISGNGIVNPYSNDELLRLIHISVLCNESEVATNDGEYILNGSSTENALLHLAIGTGIDIVQLREKFPLTRMIHRSENRNYMISYHAAAEGTGGQCLLAAVKGSPNEVLSQCNWFIKDGQKHPLTDADRLLLETENERMAGDALRVLGVAFSLTENAECGALDAEIKDDQIEMLPGTNLVWLGLVGMADPVRKGVKELIGQFHAAGIDTVMITGDQSPTAYSIGKELNLSMEEQLEILDSSHLKEMDPRVLTALCERVRVFSRVSPAHKLQIVQSFQRAGKVVAMTGDGINDGPALKAADIGIAMGHTGTDVAREVADVVIEDDNLETMIIAISQGRTIYHNIRKSVHFLLSTNISEITVMFTSIAGGFGEPLSAIQLLWINIMSDIAPGLALAMEPPEPDILTRPPRDPNEPIVKSSDFKRIFFESSMLSAGALSAYGYGIMRYGRGPQASTMAFMSLTSGQLLHALSCRSETHGIFDSGHGPGMQSNGYLNAALAGSFALQGLTLVVPGLRSLLGIAPLSMVDGLVIGGSAFLPLVVNEATKSEVK